MNCNGWIVVEETVKQYLYCMYPFMCKLLAVYLGRNVNVCLYSKVAVIATHYAHAQ